MSNHDTSLNIDLIQNIQSQLNDRLLKKLKRAIVFADNQFMEWFSLTCGIDYLTKSGVSNVKEFSPFENGEDLLKGVFFLAQPLKGMCLETLKDIICSSKFQYVIIVTNVNPASYDQTIDYFDQIRDECLIWMKDANYVCEINYERFPFAFLPQTSEKHLQSLLFLNPLSSWSVYSDNFNQLVNLETYSRLVKQELNELRTTNATSNSNVKDHLLQYYNHLNNDHLNELKSLAHSLNEMLDHLDAKEDCFSLGILSALVANELNLSSGSKHRKKTGNNKISLLLIDRNLDLTVTSIFHEETVFDKMSNLMPNLNPNSNDLKVNLSEFIFDNKFKAMLPGNLFHFSNESCCSLIEMFLTSKPKECLLDVYRKLCEIFPQSDREKKNFRINTESLKTQMKNGLKSNKKIFFENIDLIQIVSIYCQINDPKYTKQIEFEKIIANLKVLTQNIFNKDGPSVLTRIYTLFSEKAEQTDKVVNYSVSDLLMLLIYAYSLVGEECFYGSEEEDRVKKLLVDELKSNSFLNDPCFSSDRDFKAKIKENMNHSQLVDKIFLNLKSLKNFRKNLKQHSKLVVKEESKTSYEFKPLIKQVCENMIKTKVNNVPDQLLDIEYRTTNPGGEGFQNLFKSFKIGYLMNSAVKPHPLNNSTLIIYFVGGITSYEMKIVKEIFSKEKDFNVIVGGSHFYNHNKLAKYLLF